MRVTALGRSRVSRSPALLVCGVVLLLGSVGCVDEEGITSTSDERFPGEGVSARAISCRVDVQTANVSCSDPSVAPAAGVSMSVVLGGQRTYVRLSSENVSYDGGTQLFQADVSIENRTGQLLGTPDGLSATGVRVFFHTGPDVTGGTGVVTVANATATGTFTGANQPYFEYGQMLGWFETSSPMTWQWNVPLTVSSFEFTVLVDAELPGEQGVLRWHLDQPWPVGQFRALWGASGEMYAVGLPRMFITEGRSILSHFDGTAWRTEPMDIVGKVFDAVHGTSLDDIFAVGPSGLIAHFDGWRWTQQASLTAADLTGVWAVSPTDAFAVGVNGTILHYDGSSWSPQTSGTMSALQAVWGSGPSNVYAVGSGGTVLHYNGAAWAGVNTPVSGTNLFLRDVWGANASDVHVVVNGFRILRFDGVNWSDAVLPAQGGPLEAIWGSAANDVFAVGSGGVVHFNGQDWTSQATPGGTLVDVWGLSSSDVYAIGSTSGVNGSGPSLLHYDGSVWTTPRSPRNMNGLWGQSASDVFGVGPDGLIERFDGSRWTTQNSGTMMDLFDVWGASSSDIFAVGATDGGALLHFNGQAWSAQSAGTFEPLHGVWGSSGSDVFAVGDNGTIVHYDGASWTPQQSGTTADLRGVWASSSSDVFAVGLFGTVVHYDGTSWTTQLSGGSGSEIFRSVWGTSSTNVYLAGQIGAGPNGIAHYDGTSWSVVSIAGGAGNLYGIRGTSANDIYAVGSANVVVHFDGLSWAQTVGMFSVGSGRALSVWPASPSDVFVVGQRLSQPPTVTVDGYVLRGTR